ncbi:MAG TPA: alpha/beta hydrolase [Anaerolineales bacterium]|nr:alpha/beta hydrolase [Anaerolineales bacterium]
MRSTSGTFPAKDGTPLYWQHWEPDRSPRATVCLIHGHGEHVGRYEHVAQALIAAQVSLLGCDLHGHGRSGGPRGHAPSFAHILDDVDRLLEKADRSYPIFLYGHSMGASVIVAYVVDRSPELRGAVLTGPWFRLRQRVTPGKVQLARLLARVLPGFTMGSGLYVQGLSRDPEVVRKYVSDPLVHDRISAVVGHSLILAGESALRRAPEFRLPVLLMHGQADPVTDPSATRLFFDRAGSEDKTLRLWPELFHEIHNEPEKNQVLEVMVDWVRSHF